MNVTWQGTAEDRIDTRDLIEWLEAFEDEYEDAEPSDMDEDDRYIADEIERLADDGITEWEYGATLIREDAFEAYAQELAEDIGAIDRNAGWPLYCIDWKRAARELAQDYSCVTFLGHDYYVRS